MHHLGHSLTGAGVGANYGMIVPISGVSSGVAASIGGGGGWLLALVPDLDHRKSKLTRALGPVTWLLCRILIGLSWLVCLLTSGDKDTRKGTHRGFTHQPEFALGVGALVLFGLLAAGASTDVAWWGAGLVCVGILAHLPGDATSYGGLPIPLTMIVWRKMRGEEKLWVSWWLVPKTMRFPVKRITHPKEYAMIGVFVLVLAIVFAGATVLLHYDTAQQVVTAFREATA